MHKDERQIQLVALLLDAGSPLTFEQIRERFPAYGQDDEASAKRMFERDKDDLRDVGVPIDLAPLDAWESEEGYRIDPDRYYLPELSLSREEASALMILAAVPSEDDEAVRGGLRKVIYGAKEGPFPMGDVLVAAGPDTASGALAAIWGTIRDGRAAEFDYRTSSGRSSRRSVDPYALVTRSLRWYLVGRDRDQDQVRSFRLSRITSSVEPGDAATGPPDGFVAADHIAGPWETAEDDGPPARVAVSERVAWWAIRSLREARLAEERPDGWIVVEAPGQPNLETWVLGLGREAEVLEPEELRTSVRAQLERIAGV